MQMERNFKGWCSITGKTIKDVFGVSDGNLKNIQNSAQAKNTDYEFKDVTNADGTHSYQIVKKSDD